MRILHITSLIITVFFIIVSCKEIESYSEIPGIKYKSFEVSDYILIDTSALQFEYIRGLLTFEFKDVDGDNENEILVYIETVLPSQRIETTLEIIKKISNYYINLATVHSSRELKMKFFDFDSDGRLAVTAAVRKALNDKPAEFDPRKYLGPARESLKELYTHKIVNVLGSNNKA